MTFRFSFPHPFDDERSSWSTIYNDVAAFIFKLLAHANVPEVDFEDVCQDVLLAALVSLPRYDEEQSVPIEEPDVVEGAGEASAQDDLNRLRVWLFGVVWRQLSHYRDKAYRRREIAAGLWGDPGLPADDAVHDAETDLLIRERARIVDEILRRISPDRRLILLRHDVGGETIPEIADDIRINRNTAQTRLYLGRRDFQEAVKRLPPAKKAALRIGDRPFAAEASPTPRRGARRKGDPG